MFLDVVIASILVGVLRGGQLAGISTIKKIWLLGIAILLQLSTCFSPKWGPALMALNYTCLLLLGLFNWSSPAMRVITAGTLFNGLVIVANGGRMPVDEACATALNYKTDYLYSESFSQYVMAKSSTPFGFLADVILLRFPIPRVISIGDIFAIFGVFLFAQEALGKPLISFGSVAAVSPKRGD